MLEVTVEEYEIHAGTMALAPFYHEKYQTKVLEEDRIVYVPQTSLELMKQACLDFGSTYEGRREAVCHRVGFKQKVPILINPCKKIVAFPTHSPEFYDNHWIFYHHVKTIAKDPKHATNSSITFRNTQKITVNISHHLLEKQLHRTSYCVVKFMDEL